MKRLGPMMDRRASDTTSWSISFGVKLQMQQDPLKIAKSFGSIQANLYLLRY